jgi:hypothetical protein
MVAFATASAVASSNEPTIAAYLGQVRPFGEAV